MAVTEIPWPIGIEPMDVPHHSSAGSSSPVFSWGRPSAVFSPNPNRRRYSSILSAPSRWAILIVPMFDDSAMIRVTV